MSSKGLMASAFALAGLFALTMAAPSGAASITCNGSPGTSEINGNITVAENGFCWLGGGVTVKGNVTVGRGARLYAEGASPTLIRGNVRGDGAAEVRLDNTTVGGNVALTGTGETIAPFGEVIVSEGRVNGNIEIDHGQPQTEVRNETVGGSVRILNNLYRNPGAGSGETFVELEASTIGKNVEVANNTLAAPLLNVLSVRNTSVANQLLVYNNTETATAEGFLGENEIILSSNDVGGNAELLNNTRQSILGPVGPGRTDVSANAVRNILNCVGNVKPPTGEENTAKRKLGQCEAL
jgi:acetyltransferase-like isoleucine patch superfamily enzyme